MTPAAKTRLVLASLALTGCELEEITGVLPDDVVVAEVHVQLQPQSSSLRAFLHRTLDREGEGRRPVPGAHIVVTRTDGLTLELAETEQARCAHSLPATGGGTCYWAAPEAAERLEPGDGLALEIRLRDGRTIQGATTIPKAFHFVGAPPEGSCTLGVDTPLELRWTRSEGAWAYVAETLIHGLGEALRAEGVQAEDPLYLLGLSVSAADTSIVFPGEFGVFNRFELDQEVALRLQRGLPASTSSTVTIAATDRNYVNWVRGGSFNPSGLVRLPSLRGDGTGVFASEVVRELSIRVGTEGGQAPGDPPCPTGRDAPTTR
jgi:hypothetical protein